MTFDLNHAWQLLRQTFNYWEEDKVPRLGSALAYYTALSIAPLLVLSLRVAATIFGDEAARGEIERQVQSLIGDQGGQAVQGMLENAKFPHWKIDFAACSCSFRRACDSIVSWRLAFSR